MAPSDPRPLIAKPTWGHLRQGTIFSGAAADGYANCHVHGIVITARCDLTHGKVPLVNYLPIVHISDWLSRDFATCLIDRLRPDLSSRLSDLLTSEGYSPTILGVHDRHTVLDTLFPSTVTGKSIQRGTNARNTAQSLDFLDDLGRIPLGSDQLAALQQVSPRAAFRLKLDCLRNSLNGYHFLSHIDPIGAHTGFVILLRQIYHLPLPAALAVAKGADLQDSTVATLTASITPKPDGFAMPIGQLVSPYVEHLMQNFSTLFARIGVPDLPHDFQHHLAGG